MTGSEIASQMIEYAQGNLHDINHFLKVFAFARIIGEREKISQQEQLTLEIAALIHDIACPLCREKYGDTSGKHQEAEGGELARRFLSNWALPDQMADRVVYLVAHHHSYDKVDGIDYQILLEADYLVNADESHYSKENIQSVMAGIFKTPTGIMLLKTMYGV